VKQWTARRRLHELLTQIDAHVDAGDESVALRYLEEVLVANEKVNLTGINQIDVGIRLHLVDSLLGLPDVEEAPVGPLIDIGTGGGFPGVPLCIVGKRRGLLLDSVGKKANAVREALRLAGLGVEIAVVAGRSESHALDCGASYAVATARAVAELPSLVELASPLLVRGGRLVAWKGAPEADELERGDRVGAMVGMERVALRERSLPGGGERRTIIVYERRGEASTKLPRRVGLAQRKPLA